MLLRAQGTGPLRGKIRVPGDLQIGQEAILWAALAQGESLIRGLSSRADHRLLCDALRALGVPIAFTPHGVRVQGVGLHGLKLPRGALHAGDSPSTLEILTALLSGQQFGTRIEASGSASTHSLHTLIHPLRARGAHVAGRSTDDGDQRAPVAVAPLVAGELLRAVEIEVPDGDAATKRGLLISGLYADGPTAINEGMLSRDHCERALMALGAGIETMGAMTLLDHAGASPWSGFEWDVPGDFSLACFFIAAALALPGSDLLIENVGLNRSRTGVLDVLRHAGANVQVVPKGDVAGDEPIGDIRVRASGLRGVRVTGELAFRCAEDALALGALAPSLHGRLSVRDLAALRARVPDPVRAMSLLLRSCGFECTDYADGFDLEASARNSDEIALTLEGELPALGLLGVMLGLGGGRPVRVAHAERLDALYPGLGETLASLGVGITREERA